jgi:hypothetical protein
VRVVCWLRGHAWTIGLFSFGRTLYRCRRCGALTAR